MISNVMTRLCSDFDTIVYLYVWGVEPTEIVIIINNYI